jgi:phage protein D
MPFSLFSDRTTAPAECILRLGGEEIAHLYPFLREVNVTTQRLDGAQGSLILDTRRDENGAWVVQDDPLLRPWAAVEILARFGEREEEVFRGYVRKVQASYPADAGTTTVTIEIQDESLLLDRQHRRRTWGEETPTDDTSILREMLTGTPVSLHPDSAGESGLVLHQNGPDARFLRARAQSLGHELIFHEGRLYFGPMRLTGDPQPTVMVYAGPATNCIEFSLDDEGHLPDEILFDVAASEGVETEQASVAPNLAPLGPEPATSTALGLPPFAWRLDREGESDATALRTLAQARANENAMKIKVSGELDGDLYGHVLRVGETVGVDGVGERHNGLYYVDTVTHRFTAEGYRQSFRLLRNAYGDNLPAASSNPLSAL